MGNPPAEAGANKKCDDDVEGNHGGMSRCIAMS